MSGPIPARRRWRPWSSTAPVRLTSGPLSFSAPAVNPDGPRELFVLGTSPRAELVRFDSSSGRFLPYLAGFRRKEWIFPVTGSGSPSLLIPDGDLWRCQVDGAERRQLTFPPVRAFLPRWSPDGGSIAFVDISKEPWTIQVISSEGTGLRQVSPAGEAASDPTWSPAGDRLAFGGVDLTHADDPSKFVIQVLDLASGRVTERFPARLDSFHPVGRPTDGTWRQSIAASELTILDPAEREHIHTQRFQGRLSRVGRTGATSSTSRTGPTPKFPAGYCG